MFFFNPTRKKFSRTRTAFKTTSRSLAPVSLLLRHAKRFGFFAATVVISGVYFLNKGVSAQTPEIVSPLKILLQHKLETSFNLFLSGKIQESANAFMLTTDYYPGLWELFQAFEREQFNTAIKLADDMFINELKLRDVYFIFKADICHAIGRNTEALELLTFAENCARNNRVKAIACAKKALIMQPIHEEQSAQLVKKSKSYDQNLVIADNKTEILKFIENYMGISSKALDKEGVREDMLFSKAFDHTDHENFVIVRGWTTNSSLGHISIETNKNYISFWPIDDKTIEIIKGIVNPKQSALFNLYQKRCLHTYQDDLRSYGQLANLKIRFDTLDADQIDAIFENKKEEAKLWFILPLLNTQSNCAVFSYMLLRSANINRLAKYHLEPQLEAMATDWDKLLKGIAQNPQAFNSFPGDIKKAGDWVGKELDLNPEFGSDVLRYAGYAQLVWISALLLSGAYYAIQSINNAIKRPLPLMDWIKSAKETEIKQIVDNNEETSKPSQKRM